jgi:acyl dehydratase
VSDFAVGQSRRSQGRTVTEADLLAWSGLVHDFTTLHIDAEAARTLTFGERIAHGSIALTLSVGLFFPVHATWFAGDGGQRSAGWAKVRFTAPVLIGDTIHCTRTIVESSRTADGLVELVHDVQVVNQRGELVMSGRETLRSGRSS